MSNNAPTSPSTTIDVGGDSHDSLFAVLSNARRRLVLRTLQLADREMSVSELTSDIVSHEADMTGTEHVDDVRGTVEVALVHTHLPKMESAGLVSFDRAAGTVELTDRDQELDQHLGAIAAATAGDD